MARLAAYARSALIAPLALAAAMPTRADVLVGYNMDTFAGTNSLSGPAYVLPTTAVAGSFTDANLQTVALSVGSGFVAANQAGFYRFNGTGVPTTAVVSGNYMEFTLAPLPGRTFSLNPVNSVQIYSRVYDTDSAGVFIRSSLDNFAANLAQVTGVGDGAVRSFDLSGFTDIATAVTFRVYLFDTDGAANLAIRNAGTLGTTGDLEFVVNGTITVGATVPVTGVSVAPEAAAVFIGSTQQLTAGILPANATEQGITWSSSNPATATVDANGLITGVAEGSATITATTTEGGFQDTAEITVQRVAVTGVAVTPETVSLDINATQQLTANLTPANPTIPGIAWGSSDPSVASVSATGKVTAIASGTATITATASDGGFTASCLVTVTTNVAKGLGQLDPQGWTILLPSADSRLVYVSSSEGNDANDGLSPATPKATIDAADALIRDGYPDWMLLKRGDTFAQPNLGRWKNGRSAGEPLVLTSYGDTGSRPLIKLTGNLVHWNGQPRNHQAFVGLDLYRSISDPGSPDFTNTSSDTGLYFNAGSIGQAYNLLVEDCRLRFCSISVQGQNDEFFIHNAHIRRNIVANTWVHGSTDLDNIIFGMFVRGVVDVTIEENAFHHNGWSEVVAGAGANMFNHNVYMQHSNDGEIVVRGNLLSFGAAHGVQLRSGGTAVMNAFVGHAVSMNIGYGDNPSHNDGLTVVNDNVITDGRPMIPNDSAGQQTGAIWGLDRSGLLGPLQVNGNIVANILDNRGVNMRPYGNMAPDDYGTGNIAWNWVRDNYPAANPGWLAPQRNAASFATAKGWGDWNTFIAAVNNRGPRQMPIELTAYAYINYIREGFGKAPVNPPYTYGSLGDCDGPAVTGVEVASSLSLAPGEQQALIATVLPADACNKSVTWSSSDTNVATVDGSGGVSAIAPGTATITVTTNDGGFQGQTQVTVAAVVIPVTGISLTPASVTLEVGQTRTLTAAIMPANASNPGVSWSSSNPGIATVNNAGLVTAVAVGSATITGTTNDGGYTANAGITVVVPVPSITLVGFELNATNLPGGSAGLNPPDYALSTSAAAGSFTDANLEPVALSAGPAMVANSQAGFYRLNSSTTPVTPVVSGSYLQFTIDPRPGFTFSLSAVNSVQIYSRTFDVDDFSTGMFIRSSLDDYATTLDLVGPGADSMVRNFNLPGFSELATPVTFRVYLYDSDGAAAIAVRSGGSLGSTGNLELAINGSTGTAPVVPVAGVTLSPDSVQLPVNQSVQLAATVQPASATVPGVTWSSSNPGVATVSAAGLVTTVSEGTTIITVTTDDGGFQDSAEVLVQNVHVTAVSVTPGSVTLDINAKAQLAATLTPSDPTNPSIAWSSSNSAVATVNATGLVTAVATGAATITATSTDGGLTDVCSVTVTSNLAKGIGQLDARGWTSLLPSADSRLVYVSSSTGNDANDGLTPATAKATIDAANALIRDGYPDWMLLKRGDTFAQPNLGRWKSGRSVGEPMVLTAYGDTGPRPVVKLTGDFIEWNGEPRHNLAFVGLDLYRSISDPHSPDFTNTGGGDAIRFNCGSTGDAYNVLVEDCRFRYCGLTIRGQQGGAPFVHNAHVRRNIIMYNWTHNSENSDAIIQGLHCVAVMGLYIEENLIHHNGWNEVVPGALANLFNHNVYLQFNNGGEIVVTGNIISYGSAHGIQLRAGGVATMNAFVGNAVSMNAGHSSPPLFYTGPTIVSDNVVTDGRPMIPNDSEGQQTGAIWGLWHDNIANPVFNDNIVANILDNRGVNMRPFSNMTANQYGTGNIAWNWTRDNNPAADPGWLDPTRNAASFGSANGWGDWDGFIAAAADRLPGTMPFELTAYAYVNYIREGFNKAPVAGLYTYDAGMPTITLGGLRQAYDGMPKNVTATTVPSGLDVELTYNGGSVAPTLPGTYEVVATVDESTHTGTASGELVIAPAALVRRGPTFTGDIDGSVQVLQPENVTLNSNASISGDLLVPGTPGLTINGNALHAGTQDGPGAAAPSSHWVTLNHNTVLRYLVRRVDAIALPVVAPPPAPAGTVNVSLSNASQTVADWSTVRNLILNGTAGLRAVPPGTYGNLSANGASGFILGIAGATEPAVYNLQSLAINTLPGGSAQVQVVGPVIVTLANGSVINGPVGSPTHPEWLTLRIATGGLTLSGTITFHGDVVAPNGMVTLNNATTLKGTVVADRINLNGTALLSQPDQEE